MQLLTFHVKDDRYAIKTSMIVEVLPIVKLIDLPLSEPCIAGLLNYRGTAVPVVDLNILIDDTPASLLMSSRMIIINYQVAINDIRPLVLLAERATEIVQHDDSLVQDYGLAMENARFLGDVIYDDHGVIQIVDIENLLSESARITLFKSEKKATG